MRHSIGVAASAFPLEPALMVSKSTAGAMLSASAQRTTFSTVKTVSFAILMRNALQMRSLNAWAVAVRNLTKVVCLSASSVNSNHLI